MSTATHKTSISPVTPAALMEQLQLTLVEHPGGGNWMTHDGLESTAAAIGRFRVIFRLLALFKFSSAEVERLKTELVAIFAEIRDSDAQMAFYRGMSMILRPRKVKLPEKPYLKGSDSDWHKPL